MISKLAPRARIWLVAVMATTSPLLVALPTMSVAQTMPDFPLALICWSESAQEWRVGYLFRVSKDGAATYMPPGGQQSVTVSSARKVEPPKNRGGDVDCYGKTIDELRAQGRTLEIQRPR